MGVSRIPRNLAAGRVERYGAEAPTIIIKNSTEYDNKTKRKAHERGTKQGASG